MELRDISTGGLSFPAGSANMQAANMQAANMQAANMQALPACRCGLFSRAPDIQRRPPNL